MSATLVLPHEARAAGPWSRRLAVLSALFAVPLLLFGGSVTTLGAGMAVDGWLIAEGHFLLFFPVEKWFRDTATFVEHTHRLFGALVGVFAVACLAAAWLQRESSGARRGALVAVLAVGVQGTLGGFRVLENNTDLAFLHGALAQLVFAVLCANAVLFSPDWRAGWGQRAAAGERSALLRSARVAVVLTYAQVVLGAWYRHGLRPAPVDSTGLRFALHGLGAVVVLAVVARVIRHGMALLEAESAVPAGFARVIRLLPALVLVQIVLGGLAWAGFRPGAIGPAEWFLSIAHVLGGALLFASLVVVALWARRLQRDADASPRSQPGGAA